MARRTPWTSSARLRPMLAAAETPGRWSSPRAWSSPAGARDGHDDYCEKRDWDMPLCPGGTGHQGQDIRAASCKKGVHAAVAAADGTITSVGNYSVYLTAADGTRFDYLHMQDVAVEVGDKVKRG